MDFCFYEFNELKKKKVRTRQRWYPYFDTVTLIIYFVSLEGYDIPLRNDPQMTQLEEAFQIWKQLVSSPSFISSDTILFFTKSDIFKQKIERNPPTAALPFFSDMTDDSTYERIVNFIGDKFSRQNTRAFAHIISCIDTELCKKVMHSIQEYLLAWPFGMFF